MLIGTLPTFVSKSLLVLAEKMTAHPLVSAVRYNTGGDSPLSPFDILNRAKTLTDRYGKTLFVDLEGRQIRIARWTPFDAGTVVLNRDFTVTPPARVFVRNAGWFDLVAANQSERKIYLENGPDLGDYYFGESQSVHVVGGDFLVKGYLGGRDHEYIAAAKELGISDFMLSFIEEETDISEFLRQFSKEKKGALTAVVLKLESKKAIEFVKKRTMRFGEQLMAARDDLFISYGENPAGMYGALLAIIAVDPEAIVASRILQGLERRGSMTMGDISDVILMSRLGYKHFMFSDGLAKRFSQAIASWEELLPLMEIRD